jgi:hypothetical protein
MPGDIRLRNITRCLLLIVVLIKPIYSDVPLGLKGILGGATVSNFNDINGAFEQGYLVGVLGEKNFSGMPVCYGKQFLLREAASLNMLQ